MLTELKIINAMLASKGIAPLTSNDTRHPSYTTAAGALETTNSSIQSLGWWYNKTILTLAPNTAGEIVLPSNTLHADPTDRSHKLSIRGGRLYDRAGRTYAIGQAVKVAYVELIPVSDLPPTAWEYLRARAVYEFYLDGDGSNPKLGEYLRKRNEAYVAVRGEDLRNKDINYFDGGSFEQLHRGYRGNRLPLSDT
jgi:hypothetical protein